MQRAPAESSEDVAVRDPSKVDPNWPPPTSSPSGSDAMGRKTIPASLVYGSILLALVLVIVAVWDSAASRDELISFERRLPAR